MRLKRAPGLPLLIFLSVVRIPAEEWLLTTDDNDIGPDRYTLGGTVEMPVVETDYMSDIFGNAKISAIEFGDEKNAAIWFAGRRYDAVWSTEDSSLYMFDVEGRDGGIMTVLLGPEEHGVRKFAYVLEHDFSPFFGLDALPMSDSEIELLESNCLDEELIEAARNRGIRFVRYTGIVEIHEP